MSRPAVSGLDTEPTLRVDGPRHRLPRPRSRPRIRAACRVLGGLATVVVLAVTAVGWAGYRNLSGGITISQALAGGPASVGGAQNILIMGLDSRLDQHGQPLPQDIYDALHAGDETVGGYNANVLILLHLPGGNGPVSAVSVPRDDYVDLPGCPSGVCKGKIKQAYGLAYQQTMNRLSDSISQSSREQTAREAGRKAEIDTVRRLLSVPIDHFIEVTLGAFFQIAQVVQPITVCLNDDTSDSYSGAKFHRGVQQIDAAQAMAFVRQRRDENDQLFTDMDRTRRQQAFIVSLVTALRHGGALSSPSDLRNLLQVAQQNIAVDAGFDLAGFVENASALTDTRLTLYTLPISEFGQDPAGEDVNIVDVHGIRAIVDNLFTNGAPPDTPIPSQSRSAPTTLDVINATNHSRLGTAVEQAFGAEGLTAGTVTTAESLAETSTIAYGPGAGDAAHRLADRLDAVVVDQIEAGGRWRCVDNCGKGGILDDPATSAAAAAAVVAGHRIYGSREELKATVAVDVARAAMLAPLLAGAGGPVEDVAVAVRSAVALVRRVGEGAVLSDAELAGIGAMLLDLRVRDALMTLVDCDESGAAEQLWSQLVRVLPQPFRSEALVMASHSAYVRGNGPLAGVCLEAVQAEDPSHRMAELLDTALQSGVRPEAIRGLTAGLPPAVSV